MIVFVSCHEEYYKSGLGVWVGGIREITPAVICTEYNIYSNRPGFWWLDEAYMYTVKNITMFMRKQC